MLGHKPLPKTVLDIIVNARIFAQRAGASRIEPAHLSAALQVIGSVVSDVEVPRDLALADSSKAAIKEAVKRARSRDSVTIEDLRATLISE